APSTAPSSPTSFSCTTTCARRRIRAGPCSNSCRARTTPRRRSGDGTGRRSNGRIRSLPRAADRRMIIRRAPASLLLITQPDHARQSAEIMRHWRADRFPESAARSVILLAVAEHDNGWREVDAAPVVDDGGRVLDFMSAPAAVRRGIWPRAVDRLASTPYAAALVAQHALNVYWQYRANPEWQSFFSQMEATRNQDLLAAAPATLQDL